MRLEFIKQEIRHFTSQARQEVRELKRKGINWRERQLAEHNLKTANLMLGYLRDEQFKKLTSLKP